METATQTPHLVKEAYQVMRLTYGLVPIVAGIDKFTNLLTNWEQYLHPALTQALPFSPAIFMMLVGVIEIIAGLVVLTKPHIGGFIVMAWLALIGVSLIAANQYLDVAVRDLVMAIGAFSLARLARTFAVAKAGTETNRKVAFS